MTWLLLIPLLIILPFIGSFLYIPGSQYSDLLVSHFPNALYLHNSIFQDGVLPFWSGRILSGFPFAANPLSGMWYPFGWLPVLFPTAWAFNLTTGLHIVWGGIGMYRWLRYEGISSRAALTAALAFELMPKIWAHQAAGHISLVYAIAWTPWLLFASKNAIDRMPRWSAWPGLVLGLMILADVRWAALGGALWLAYSIRLVLVGFQIKRSSAENTNRGLWQGNSHFFKGIIHILAHGITGILASTVLLLPLLEYSRLSTRSLMTPIEAAAFSLDPSRLINILIPDWGGGAENVVYPGQVILMLALAAVSLRIGKASRWFWLGCAGICLILALGSNLPGWNRLEQIPFTSMLRVPSRWLLLFVFSLIVLAAQGLDILLDVRLNSAGRAFRYITAALVEISILVAIMLWLMTDVPYAALVWAGAASAITLAFIYIYGLGKISSSIFWTTITLLVILDGGVYAFKSFTPRSPSEVFSEGSAAAEFVSSKPGKFRVYSPSYSIPQQTAAVNNLELADGVDPLQLTSYTIFMVLASGVPSDGYSVTLPPFANAEPATDNKYFVPDSRLLGLLNVEYVVSEFELNSKDLSLRARVGETSIYQNDNARPRVWIQNKAGEVDHSIPQPRILSENANEIVLETFGAGVLMLSEINYPGWMVEIDGIPVEQMMDQALFRSVMVPEGIHTVRWHFEPVLVKAGIIISSLTWLCGLGFILKRKKYI